jgi:hypothetical protein
MNISNGANRLFFDLFLETSVQYREGGAKKCACASEPIVVIRRGSLIDGGKCFGT